MYDKWSPMKRLIWLKMITDGGGAVVTATGVSPLSLLNAIAKEIRSLKQYGKCVQSGTPTLNAPVDIVCNNGALCMVHRSGLPSGYKLLEYVGGSGSEYVITDLHLASTDVVECEFRNSTTTGYGAVYGIYKVGESSALYSNKTYYGYDSANDKVDTEISVNTDWHTSRHDFVNATLTIDDTTVTFTPFEFENSTKSAVLARYYNNSYGYGWKGYVRKFKVTRSNEVICDLLPCKNEQDVVGFYDLATETFYSPTGGALLEGNVVYDYELAVEGTAEVLTVSANGAATQSVTDIPMLLGVGDYKDEQDIVSGLLTHKVGIYVFDGTETWATDTYGGSRRMVLQEVLNASGDTLPVLCSHYVSRASDARQQPNSIFIASSGKLVIYIDSTQNISTVEEFNAWLASEYANGKPVIVLYPLAEETTAQTTPHSLRTTDGTNIVSVTSNVDPVELEVEYTAKAS